MDDEVEDVFYDNGVCIHGNTVVSYHEIWWHEDGKMYEAGLELILNMN